MFADYMTWWGAGIIIVSLIGAFVVGSSDHKQDGEVLEQDSIYKGRFDK